MYEAVAVTAKKIILRRCSDEKNFKSVEVSYERRRDHAEDN
jgi:hypothetical protein